MKNIIPQEISDEEAKVLELESRHAVATTGLATASEAKKKIEEDSKKLLDQIESNKVTVENSNKEIITLNESITELKSFQEKEKGLFDEVEKKRKDTEKDLEDFKLSAKNEMEKLTKSLKDFEDQIKTRKDGILRVMEDLKNFIIKS